MQLGGPDFTEIRVFKLHGLTTLSITDILRIHAVIFGLMKHEQAIGAEVVVAHRTVRLRRTSPRPVAVSAVNHTVDESVLLDLATFLTRHS